MAKLNVKVTGLEDIVKRLDAKSIISDIDEVFNEVYAEELRTEAVLKAPVDVGFLRASIFKKKNKELNYSVIVGAEYGAFVEFGTKTRVQVDPEMVELASQFRGKKINSGNFKDNILQWMRNKGIPDEALFSIMAKILGVGIKPQPYLTPAYKKVKKDIEQNFDKVLNKIINERR